MSAFELTKLHLSDFLPNEQRIFQFQDQFYKKKLDKLLKKWEFLYVNSKEAMVGLKNFECGIASTIVRFPVKVRLPSILNRYEEEDVFNVDETDLFFKALSDRSLVGKKSKERYTVMLCSNLTGT